MVRLVQLLCEHRHCILASAYDDKEETKDHAIKQIEGLLDLGISGRFCGICGSKDLHYEEGVTKWETLEEAMPHLAKAQIEQIKSRAAIETLRSAAAPDPSLN